MTSVQKAVPAVVLVVILLAVGWVLLPFEFTAGVKCGAPLLGAKAKSERSVGLVLPVEDCKRKGRSRLLVSAMISLVAVGAGTAAIALKPMSAACNAGNHDDCREGWANLLSDSFSGLGCQCECHGASGY